MINDAFLFFWLVGIAADIDFVCGGLFFLGVSAALFVGVACMADESSEPIKRFGKYVLILVFVPALVGILTPPKEAFYAGAAQYVGEATEMDATLLDIKKLVDKKIAELDEAATEDHKRRKAGEG